MTLLGMPMGNAVAPGPVVAKVGDWVISKIGTTLGYQMSKVTKITAVRYYYTATLYVLRSDTVWVGTEAKGNALMSALTGAMTNFVVGEKNIINAAGGWA